MLQSIWGFNAIYSYLVEGSRLSFCLIVLASLCLKVSLRSKFLKLFPSLLTCKICSGWSDSTMLWIPFRVKARAFSPVHILFPSSSSFSSPYKKLSVLTLRKRATAWSRMEFNESIAYRGNVSFFLRPCRRMSRTDIKSAKMPSNTY